LDRSSTFTATEGYSVAYNGRIWVATGNLSTPFYSTDGLTWTASTNTASTLSAIQCCAWNGTLWCAGAGWLGFLPANLIYSYDAKTWYASTTPASLQREVDSMVYNPALKMLFAGSFRNTSTDYLVHYSYDGLTWQPVLESDGFTSANAVFGFVAPTPQQITIQDTEALSNYQGNFYSGTLNTGLSATTSYQVGFLNSNTFTMPNLGAGSFMELDFQINGAGLNDNLLAYVELFYVPPTTLTGATVTALTPVLGINSGTNGNFMRLRDRFSRPPVGTSITINFYIKTLTGSHNFSAGNWSLVINGLN